MISVITPVHRLIPWWNIRILAMCMQTYKDWEWIILDNSKDGFVKGYIDNFFENLQGVHYQDCKHKIKVFYETFDDVSIDNGKIGKLKNRCVELSSAKDEDIIVVLDYDDFINVKSLEYINNAISETNADICRMDIITETCEDINSGLFFSHNLSQAYCMSNRLDLYKKFESFNKLYSTEQSFKEYVDNNAYGNTYMNEQICEFDYNMVKFRYNMVRKHNPEISIIDDCGDHFIGKKKSLLNCGGFYTNSAIEDTPLLYNCATECKIVYVPYPWISIITMTDNGIIANTANNNSYKTSACNDIYVSYMEDLFLKRYRKFGLNKVASVIYNIT